MEEGNETVSLIQVVSLDLGGTLVVKLLAACKFGKGVVLGCGWSFLDLKTELSG